MTVLAKTVKYTTWITVRNAAMAVSNKINVKMHKESENALGIRIELAFVNKRRE